MQKLAEGWMARSPRESLEWLDRGAKGKTREARERLERLERN